MLPSEWWVGISDAASDGTFQFESNGEIFPFTSTPGTWNGNEPDGGDSDNCVVMSKDSAMFSDVSCTGSVYHSVCELSSSRTSPTGDYKIELCFERDSVNPFFFVDFLIYFFLIYIIANIRIIFTYLNIIFQINAINVFWKQVLLIQQL